MKYLRVSLPVVATLLLILASPVVAGESWLEKLNPFAKKEPGRTTAVGAYPAAKAEPSALEKLDQGTKRFFGGAFNVLTGKKPAPKSRAGYTYAPWPRVSKDSRYGAKQEKKSWLGSLFQREEPKRVESLKDWVGLPRPEP